MMTNWKRFFQTQLSSCLGIDTNSKLQFTPFSKKTQAAHKLTPLNMADFFSGHLVTQVTKGVGKRGHIVADTLLPTQMSPR